MRIPVGFRLLSLRLCWQGVSISGNEPDATGLESAFPDLVPTHGCLVSRFRSGIAYRRELLTARLTFTCCARSIFTAYMHVCDASMCLNPRWENYTVLALHSKRCLYLKMENWNLDRLNDLRACKNGNQSRWLRIAVNWFCIFTGVGRSDDISSRSILNYDRVQGGTKDSKRENMLCSCRTGLEGPCTCKILGKY